MPATSSPFAHRIRQLAWFSIATLVLGVAMRVGYYVDTLSYTVSTTGMAITISAATLAFIGAMLALARTALREWHTAIFIAALPLLPSVGLSGMVLYQLMTTPMLYDITTNITNPPDFQEARMLRTASDHDVAFAADTAALQQAAYPDIKPLYSTLPPENVFMASWELTTRLGWHAFHQDAHNFTLEATHKPLWIGAKEDIVIAVQAQKNGTTRIDLRSASRQGFTDLGANADNIRKFIAGYPAAEKDVIAFVTSGKNSNAEPAVSPAAK